MASKRRYPVGKHKEYDKAFDRRRVDSSILNAGSKRASINTVFFDKKPVSNYNAVFLAVRTRREEFFENNDGD